VGRCTKNVSPSERQVGVAIYTKDLFLPFHFHDSQVLYPIIDMTGILAEVSSPTLEDDLVVLNAGILQLCGSVLGLWRSTYCQRDCGRIVY